MSKSALVHVYYPSVDGLVVLRTDADWGLDVHPTYTANGTQFAFEVTSDKPFVCFKPCLRRGSAFQWSVGSNMLLHMDSGVRKVVYPYFFSPDHGSFSGITELSSRFFQEPLKFQVYLPPGYHENILSSYPVLYLHDDSHLFFPQEASFGGAWQFESMVGRIDSLRIIRRAIIVGVWPIDDKAEYTRSIYKEYGQFLVKELKPFIDHQYRTLPDRQNCAVIGSGVGGVVSFYVGWEYPMVYGMAACLSSPFGFISELRERVANESKRNVRFYLDSGLPDDTYEVTKDMVELLSRRGYKFGEDVVYFYFPGELHHEKSWAARIHLPYQYFFER